MRQRGLRHERLNLLLTAAFCVVALLGVRLMHMQVIRNMYYLRVAESNRTQIIHQAAPRGRMYDRNGDIVATSRPAFSLIYLPGKEKEPEYLIRLSEILSKELHRSKEDLLELLKEAQREESAIHLAENLSLKPMFRLSELKTIYPGVDLIVEARRYYPNGPHAGHLLGYMGKMDKRSWRKLKSKGYRVDSWIGRSGLEKQFEDRLRGIDGEIRMEVNAQGSLKRKIGATVWRQGSNVHLELDSRIQKAVEEGLRNSPSGKGAAVVLDPRTGAVLAMASVPDFDPNLFLLPDWDEAKQAIKDFPEFNRAIAGTYSPASTFKIIVGAAMMEKGEQDPAEKIFCPGSFHLGNRTFKCWEKKGHKNVDWIEGLTHSCDVYFYKTGLKTGGSLIEQYAKQFHLGKKVGVLLRGEQSGNMFGPEARKKHKRGWYDGDTVNLSIGQGEMLVTPIQMAVMISGVANRGTLWRPHFTKRIESSDGRTLHAQTPESLGKVHLKAETWDSIHAALLNVVENGTGQRVRIAGLDVRGKTGTAENPRGEDHAWFVAFAGREGEVPSLALSILVEHGGHGSSAAGPIARQAIQAAFQTASIKKISLPIPASVPRVRTPAIRVPLPAVQAPAAPAIKTPAVRPARSSRSAPSPFLPSSPSGPITPAVMPSTDVEQKEIELPAFPEVDL